jgi:uncharacterized membrane protein YbaN (DUF454 family)
VILAGYFFIRSSPAAHNWLSRSRWFGTILRDWEEHHGVSRATKAAALGLIAVGAVVTALIGLPMPLTISIFAMQFVGAVIVLRLPGVAPSHPALLAPTV